MKTKLATLLMTLACGAMLAAEPPIMRSGWTTTNHAATAREALGAMASMDGSATNPVFRGNIRVPDGAVVGYLWMATNSNGSGTWAFVPSGTGNGDVTYAQWDAANQTNATFVTNAIMANALTNHQQGVDLPSLISTGSVFSAIRLFDTPGDFPRAGVLTLQPDGFVGFRIAPVGVDLQYSTNLPFNGLSAAARTTITNILNGVTVTNVSYGNVVDLTSSRLVGRTTGGVGAAELITVSGGLTLSGLNLDGPSTNGFQTLASIQNRLTNNVANALLRTYNIRDAGASNNAAMVIDCWMTNGNQTLTTANGSFSAADVGKVITVWFAGPTNRNLTTFITNVTSATVCTLSNAASANVTNVSAAYGSDDTVYVQTEMNRRATNGGGTIFFPGYSIIAGALQDPGAWATHHNAQLYFPEPTNAVGTICASVTFAGPTPIGKANSASVSERQSLFGGGIISTLAYDPATTAPGAVVDCRNFSNPVTQGGAVQIKYNALRVDFLNFGFIVAFDNNLRCLNIEGAIGGHVTESFVSCGYDVSAPRYWPVGTNGFAVKLPGNFNNNDNGFHRSVIGSGFYNAMSLAENARIEGSLIMFPQNALVCDNGMSGAAFITSTEIQEATNVFKVGSTACKITGDMALYYHVITNGMKIRDDPGHALFGNVRVYMEGESTVSIPLPDVGGNGMFDYVQTAAGNPYIKHGGPFQLQDSGKGYAVGADVGTNTLTSSASKFGAISFPRYSGIDYVPGIGWRAFNANTHILELGGSLAYNYSGGGVKAPATVMDFVLSNDGSTAPRHHLRWDGASGVLTPQINLTLGTGANPFGTVTATQVVSSLFTGNFAGGTNGSPNIATNNATATDGQVLVKRGNNLSLETISAGTAITGMQTNQFTTNVVGQGIVGNAIFNASVTISNGIYGRSNLVFHVPTNAPTDGQHLAAVGTTGITKWVDSTSGVGGTNQFYPASDPDQLLKLGGDNAYWQTFDADGNRNAFMEIGGSVTFLGNLNVEGGTITITNQAGTDGRLARFDNAGAIFADTGAAIIIDGPVTINNTLTAEDSFLTSLTATNAYFNHTNQNAIFDGNGQIIGTNDGWFASAYVAATNAPALKTDANGKIVARYDSWGLTNQNLANLISMTNAAPNGATVNFALPECTTNAAGNIGFTAISNFNPTNYNTTVIHVLANGGDRTVTAGTGWRKSRSTMVVTNGTMADFIISAQIGYFTNISQVDYFP